jgi:hypothetical protein
MKTLAPTNPKDRFEVFNGLTSEAKEGLDSRRLRVPLVKTFLLEHVASRENQQAKPPAEIFRGIGAGVHMLDERFMALDFEDYDSHTARSVRVNPGYLEQYDERFFAYYTCEDSETARKRVSKWTQFPDLDFTWFSSPLLQVLWDNDVSKRGDERFTRLRCRHESIFDMPDDFSVQDDHLGEAEASDVDDDAPSSEEHKDFERRKTSITMGDSIGRIRKALSNLQGNYAPLHALSALRFPSRTGRGGHELFQTGQVTNRTDSFEEHRNIVRYLYRIYNSILKATEESAWPSINEQERLRGGMKGVPLIIKFAEELSESTFNRWVQMAFQKRNRFKLLGNPIRLGPKKVHVYGADRHLWQPINLELTAGGLVAILPHGTCGNTFHRLITNVQQYVSPEITAWVGSQPFEELVRKWPANAEQDDEN